MKVAILAAIAFALAPSAYASEVVNTIRGAGCFRGATTAHGYINIIPAGRRVEVTCYKQGEAHSVGSDWSTYWYRTPYGCFLSGVDFREWPRSKLNEC